MAPKRKAAGTASERSAKRVASGVSTPVSLGSDSDDDYSESGEVDEVSKHRLDSQYLVCYIVTTTDLDAHRCGEEVPGLIIHKGQPV